MLEEKKGSAKDHEALVMGLTIEELKLDENLKHQPVFFEMVCEHAAFANKVLDEANLALEKLEASTDLVVRAKHENADKKPTETSIKSQVASEAAVVAAKQAVIAAQFDKLTWQNLRGAYEMRSQSLQDMVKLVSCGYAAYTNRK